MSALAPHRRIRQLELGSRIEARRAEPVVVVPVPVPVVPPPGPPVGVVGVVGVGVVGAPEVVNVRSAPGVGPETLLASTRIAFA